MDSHVEINQLQYALSKKQGSTAQMSHMRRFFPSPFSLKFDLGHCRSAARARSLGGHRRPLHVGRRAFRCRAARRTAPYFG